MTIIYIIAIGIVWALAAEIVIAAVMTLGRIKVTGDRLAVTLFRWTLFSLGGLGVAIMFHTAITL